MSDGKDPAIKLFGKTIQLPDVLTDGGISQDAVSGDGGGGAGGDGGCVKSEDRPSSSSSSSEAGSKGVREDRESDADNTKDLPEEKSIDKEEDRAHSTISEEVTEPNATSMLNETSKTTSAENESASAKASKTEEEQSEQEKTLKKPDKILPCPRCNSMDTKFCYYNNYNVNQPRHFCKNCQRYWTAGGTMRNVPVGAGRRKNKSSASQYRQITVTETLPSELNNTVLKPNGTVLTFGSDTPLCESMASVLKIADKTMRQDSFRKPEELIIPVPSGNDDNANRSSAAEMQNCHGFSPQVTCFPGAPWPYPWNPQMGPAFCPPGFPMPFYPAAPYWGCAIPVPGPGPGPWNMHWVPPPSTYPPAPPASYATSTSGPISPTLGKHSRAENGEEEMTKENEPEKSLWIPKTLRIDDPDEAAKSSIWATLGIKNDRSVGVNGGGIFKAFQSKSEEKSPMKETSPALQANPAALSRSLNFQESS